MVDIKEEFLQQFINFLIKKLLVEQLKMKSYLVKNQQGNYTFQSLVNFKNENNFKNSPFIDNIWGADLANMQLISKFIKGIPCLLCVIDISSKCTWVIPLKDKKGTTITNDFQ